MVYFHPTSPQFGSDLRFNTQYPDLIPVPVLYLASALKGPVYYL